VEGTEAAGDLYEHVAVLRRQLLKRGTIEICGKFVKLAPSIQMSAAVKTGRRRVIDSLWAPVQQAVCTSAKEQ
jgi:hemolysin D